MKKNTKAIISIVIAGAALLFIVFTNRASAPATDININLVNTPTTTISGSVPHQTATTSGAIRGFTLTSGKQAIVDGYKFTLTAIEDSRCPKEVVCIRAGDVRTHVQVEYGSVKKDFLVTFPGDWVSVGDRLIRIQKVFPEVAIQNTPSNKVVFETRR